MATNAIDQRTRFRMREYLHQSVHMKNAAAQRRILAQLSPGLHSEVVWKMTSRWLSSVRFLRGVEKELLIALAFHVSARVFPPGEICPGGVLYIIHKGTALYAGKMYKGGGCFGEDILMRASAFVARSHAIAYRFCPISDPSDSYLSLICLVRSRTYYAPISSPGRTGSRFRTYVCTRSMARSFGTASPTIPSLRRSSRR